MLTDETRPPTEPAPGAGGARTDDTDASAPTDRHTHARRRWALLAAAVVVALVAALLAIWAMGDEGGDDETSGRGATVTEPEPETETTPEATTGPTSADPDPDPGTAGSAVPGPTESAPTAGDPVIEDGRHPVYLTAVDVAGRTVEFDLIQWLTGAEARDAWTAANPDMPGDPPNDFFVVNDNPALRVLPVARDVPVTVLDHGWAPVDITFEELPGFMAADLFPEDGFLWHNPFWLTVSDGTVTAIEEQYTP